VPASTGSPPTVTVPDTGTGGGYDSAQPTTSAKATPRIAGLQFIGPVKPGVRFAGMVRMMLPSKESEISLSAGLARRFDFFNGNRNRMKFQVFFV
jgi:hypothetical protein